MSGVDRSERHRAAKRAAVWAVLALAVCRHVASIAPAEAQEPLMHAGQLANAVDRLATAGRVLYIAAHPDDENTQLLAYLTNARHLTVAYLSMTRGGGGQNLIGPEQAELLGVIRTQELLAARRLDRAAQRFTRMRDFGYSKSAEETLAAWGHDEALADVVWVIRGFQPDVVIARFSEEPPNHGHHTASAILAREALEAAADPRRFPEQLQRGVEPWQAARLLRNVSPWREDPPPKDSVELEIGAYDPRLGLAYGELAALSRSQHKSQGFGRAGVRGPIVERFVAVAGSEPTDDIFDGLELGWERFGDDATAFTTAIGQAQRALDRDRPEAAIPAMVLAHRALAALPDVVRVRDAREQLSGVIAAAAGLFMRAAAQRPSAVPGSDLEIGVEIILRRPAAFTLARVILPDATAIDVDERLSLNEQTEITRTLRIPSTAPVSAPYWLRSGATAEAVPGHHALEDPGLVGSAEGPAPLSVALEFIVGDEPIRLQIPVVYVWTDRVRGERLRRFLVVPPATVTPARKAVLFPNDETAVAAFSVRAGRDDLRGSVILPLPAGWHAEPSRVPVELARAGDETIVRFELRPAAGAPSVRIAPTIEVDGESWSWREQVIDYPHIPLQVVLQPSTLKLVPLQLQVPAGVVGYIQGSGDTVAADLAHVGVEVELLDDDTIRGGDLGRYAAIVVGIRAYNTRDALRGAHDRLMDYVEAGGTVVVQYNTHSRWAPLDVPVGPFPLTIGRGRVTDETAEVVAIDPEHRTMRRPNVIVDEDFGGWVQERGLYFAETWDDRYRPLFRIADPGEEPSLGSTLSVQHGEGQYVYTGLAFFRQLPAGVPGAYRLFANLIAP